MALDQQRIAMLEQRCTPGALEHLGTLKSHPKCPVLVERLEQIGGTIYRLDVGHHFLEILRE